MPGKSPNFAELSAIEEELLVAKLRATRESIVHAGEKGRTLERAVMDLLRTMLPAEYGLSTGFVVYHSGEGVKLSPQLDIIIYDSVRGGPLISLQTCDVFPLESVHAYVEVKASIRSVSDKAKELPDDSIEKCLQKNQQLRQMKVRKFWVPAGGVTVELKTHKKWMSVRSYLLAFEASGAVAGDINTLAQRISDYSKHLGVPTHFHGVFVAGLGYLRSRAVDVTHAKAEDYFHVKYTTDHPFLAFKSRLLTELGSFPRAQKEWVPAVDQYYEHKPEWEVCVPVA